jgi:sodium-dependent phosphate cotransporter
LTIALVHLLFNLAGVLIFYPIPAVRQIPLKMSRLLARKAQETPLWLVAYVFGMFVFLPLLGYLLFRN